MLTLFVDFQDMSKKKGKDKNKVDNKPAYFDLSTLRLQPLRVILLSTALTAAGAYSPFIFLVSKEKNTV